MSVNMALDDSDDVFHDTLGNESQSGFKMNDHPDPVKCADNTQQITIHLPCRLADRVDKYTKENGNTVTGVVIEALDTLLRGQKASF